MSQVKSLPRRDFLKAAGAAAGVALAGPPAAASADVVGPDATPEAPVEAAAAAIPVLGYEFQLVFGDVVYATFSEVTGIGSENTVVQMRGGDGIDTYIPGALKWMPVSLKRGIMATDKTALDLWNWRQLVMTGKGFRKDGSIVMLKIDMRGISAPVAQWNFTRGWPNRIEAPVPAADGSTMALEAIDLTCDEIVRVPPALG